MMLLDMSGFDRTHYKIEYVRREFLGEVRCLVFDVDPVSKKDKGRFVGRIWVEDQDFHIVRFNGAYGGSSLTSNYFNFDSWRTNVGRNLWLQHLFIAKKAASTTRGRSILDIRRSGRRRGCGVTIWATRAKSRNSAKCWWNRRRESAMRKPGMIIRHCKRSGRGTIRRKTTWRI